MILMALSRRQKLTIISLLFYWPTIFILSHIPIPQLVRQAGLSDKTLHFLVYMILAFLLWFAVSPYRKVNWRGAAVWWVLGVLVLYGVVDEVLQHYVGRSCDVMDLLMDVAGALTGLLLLSFFTFWSAALAVMGATIFGLANLARKNPADLLPVTSALFYVFAYAFFTLVWIRYLRLFPLSKPIKVKGLIESLALPTALLVAVKLFSIILGRDFGAQDMFLSAIGAAAAVAAVYLPSFFRSKHDLSRSGRG